MTLEGGLRMPDSLDQHYDMLIKEIIAGRVVPFLGAGANRCGRPAEAPWQHGQYLPDGSELAACLAKYSSYPPSEIQVLCPICNSTLVHCPSCKPKEVHLVEKTQDLLRVSQYVAVTTGSGPLYEELHALFDADYPPTLLHEFLATIPAVLHEKGYPLPYQLIVTTNYDDVLERAFQTAGEPFDLVTYVAEGEQCGKFLHWLPDGKMYLIEKPNEYSGLPLEQRGNMVILNRTVILKIHGTVDRANAEQDSFVITEDHYIDYLTHTPISNVVPVKLMNKLKKSHLLFLGYSLRDWNLRVFLHRIWREQKHDYKPWAIQLNPQELDQKSWMKRGVEILNVRLEDYVAALSERLQALPCAGEGT
jgi:hypothetical protein